MQIVVAAAVKCMGYREKKIHTNQLNTADCALIYEFQNDLKSSMSSFSGPTIIYRNCKINVKATMAKRKISEPSKIMQ